MKTCGINAQLITAEASYRRAGIHVYLLEVLRNLPDDKSIEYKVFSSGPLHQCINRPIKWEQTNSLTANPIGRILWEQFVWPIRARRLGCQLLHGAAFALPLLSRLPAIVTIFDLSFLHYPHLYPSWRRRYLTFITRQSCRKANHIITISNSGKQDLINFFGIKAEKISVVYPGLNQKFKRPEESLITAYRENKRLPSRFLLHVGTLQPRKNLPFLIRAFHRAHLTNVNLVFAGGKGWYYDEIFRLVKELNLEQRVHFLGYIDDEELPLLYAAADLLVFPSIYEGFGMPILESMGCGTPVLASNASAMPEAVGNAGLLFNPTDLDDLTAKMIQLIENPAELKHFQTVAPDHAATFSWQKAGEQTSEIYKKVLKYDS
ncbi:MAG: glycosyltransferase family 1 protein [Chloroflexota bacterium]